MNPRRLVGLLSSLVSELLLLLLLLFPSSSNPISITHNSSFYDVVFPLLLHFLSASEAAATFSLLSFPRKRKRTHLPESDFLEPHLAQTGINSPVSHNPDSFKNFYNMSSSTFDWLCGLLEPLLECRDPIDSPLKLAAETRLGIGLFRLATGSDYPEISSRFCVSEPVAKFCVKQLCRVLCTNFRFWVRFPSQHELESVSNRFESLAGVPNCCGVLCCTRYNMLSNYGFNSILKEESIAAQLVVDSSSRILSIIAGFHGHKCDYNVLKSSTLFQDVENGKILNSKPLHINGVVVPQFFVGDGEYPLLPWLMIPFDHPISGSKEENFNIAHDLMRAPGIKAVASLRNWGVLSKPIETEVKAAVAGIGACSILHNMLLSREDYSAFCDDLGDYSLYNRNSCNSGVVDQNPSDNVASDVRSVLATKAREFSSHKQ